MSKYIIEQPSSNEVEISLPNGIFIKTKDHKKPSTNELKKIGHVYKAHNASLMDFVFSNLGHCHKEFGEIYNKCIRSAYELGKSGYPLVVHGPAEDDFHMKHPDEL
jgi:hypothetical protein